jgi:hypothetical protein
MASYEKKGALGRKCPIIVTMGDKYPWVKHAM